jgi:hypothetical protein
MIIDGMARPIHVLPLEKRAEIIEHLMEGSGLRPAARVCRIRPIERFWGHFVFDESSKRS